jgi:hypothetical protein
MEEKDKKENNSSNLPLIISLSIGIPILLLIIYLKFGPKSSPSSTGNVYVSNGKITSYNPGLFEKRSYD